MRRLGSSPQARGTALCGSRWLTRRRFIPAGAGNGGASGSGAGCSAVHPRRRGERPMSLRMLSRMCGSSPQARGTAWLRPRTTNASTVHPRRRGERPSNIGPGIDRRGSSPQARGTARGSRAEVYYERFIPAGAGNGKCPTTPEDEPTVHPRRRGERQHADPGTTHPGGSSPQARGTARRPEWGWHVGRFIPAGAGNGNEFVGRATRWPVHPRRRGERLCEENKVKMDAGSSPQARGTVRRCTTHWRPPRFIPAGAGNGAVG